MLHCGRCNWSIKARFGSRSRAPNYERYVFRFYSVASNDPVRCISHIYKEKRVRTDSSNGGKSHTCGASNSCIRPNSVLATRFAIVFPHNCAHTVCFDVVRPNSFPALFTKVNYTPGRIKLYRYDAPKCCFPRWSIFEKYSNEVKGVRQ